MSLRASPVTPFCYLCHSTLKDLVVLKCCHGLCKSCLHSYWEFRKRLQCPVCLMDTRCSVGIRRLNGAGFAPELKLNVGNEGSETREQSCESRDKEVETPWDASVPTGPKESEDVPSKLKCLKCDMNFKTKTTLKAHEMRKHSLTRPYQCSTCEKSYVRKSELAAHTRMHIRQTQKDTMQRKKKVLDCPHCMKKFFKPSVLKIHIRTHTGEKPFPCPLCGTCFHCNDYLRQHLRYVHERTPQHQCEYCGRLFSRASGLKYHKAIHTGERPFSCPQCDKTFIRKDTMVAHLQAHSGIRPFSCSVCGKGFLCQQNLKNHLLIHEDHRPFHCIQCPSSFKRLSCLTSHMKVHNSDRPYSCTVCSKTFKCSTGLQQHKLNHTQLDPTVEKYYSCEQCGKRFSSPYKLKRHTGVHSEERPYKCLMCDKSFRLKSVLAYHQFTHFKERPFDCGTCGKKFIRRYNLKKHKCHDRTREALQDAVADRTLMGSHENNFTVKLVSDPPLVGQ